MASKEERVRAKSQEIMAGFDGIDAATRLMLADMVDTFAWYSVTCEDLMAAVDREGTVVDGKENPNLAVLHKTSSRKHEYFGKISTVARRAQSDESDALMDFIG